MATTETEKGGWISVSERLPDDKQTCICAADDVQNAFVARYVGGREFHDFFKNWVSVDYWQPLPALPEVRDDRTK